MQSQKRQTLKLVQNLQQKNMKKLKLREDPTVQHLLPDQGGGV